MIKKIVKVVYDDFDKSGLRKNGEKLPLGGCVRTVSRGFAGQHCIEILSPESPKGRISAVALIYETAKDVSEAAKIIGKGVIGLR